jgi:hypothetical protein
MFPLGGNIDVLAHHKKLREVIGQLDRGDYAQAIRVIEGRVQQLTSEAEASIEKAWFLPKAARNIGGALVDLEGRFGIVADDLDRVRQTQEYKRRILAPMPVRRTLGWLGYFWWELYQDVKAHTLVAICKSCGNVIRGGHADRQYCTRKENPTCTRGRNASALKKSRATPLSHRVGRGKYERTQR